MFTGIIEQQGEVVDLRRNNTNLDIYISAPFTAELKIDQSVAHNGVCLTVVEIKDKIYKVTAIEETLLKTNLGKLEIGSLVNLERCTQLGQRLDGHIVQGHVDTTAIVKKIIDKNGSWLFEIEHDKKTKNITVQKGSVCVNGVSLTVVDSSELGFSVAIIPYTFEHTNFKVLKPGDVVNLEFDILGKYIAKLFSQQIVK